MPWRHWMRRVAYCVLRAGKCVGNAQNVRMCADVCGCVRIFADKCGFLGKLKKAPSAKIQAPEKLQISSSNMVKKAKTA